MKLGEAERNMLSCGTKCQTVPTLPRNLHRGLKNRAWNLERTIFFKGAMVKLENSADILRTKMERPTGKKWTLFTAVTQELLLTCIKAAHGKTGSLKVLRYGGYFSFLVSFL